MLELIRRKVIFKKRRNGGREEREKEGEGRERGASSLSCGLEFIMASVTVSVYVRMCFFFLTLSAWEQLEMHCRFFRSGQDSCDSYRVSFTDADAAPFQYTSDSKVKICTYCSSARNLSKDHMLTPDSTTMLHFFFQVVVCPAQLCAMIF